MFNTIVLCRTSLYVLFLFYFYGYLCVWRPEVLRLLQSFPISVFETETLNDLGDLARVADQQVTGSCLCLLNAGITGLPTSWQPALENTRGL